MVRLLPTVFALAAATLLTPVTGAQMVTPKGPLPKALPPDTVRPERSAGGCVLQRDAEVAREEPGTHQGGGRTIGYSFFKDTPKLGVVFRKRALKPGSAIGYHEQHEDEIYYVLSGRGLMKIDGKDGGRPGDGDPDTARQLTWPQAGGIAGPGDFDQLPAAAGALNAGGFAVRLAK